MEKMCKYPKIINKKCKFVNLYIDVFIVIWKNKDKLKDDMSLARILKM